MDKVQNYWLLPYRVGNAEFSRVHDAIVVKITPVPQGKIPKRMKVDYTFAMFIYNSNDFAHNRLGIFVYQMAGYRMEIFLPEIR